MDSAQAGRRIEELLGLQSRAVAVAFVPEPPAGLPRVNAPAVASCAYWKMAGDGASFYTEQSDHLNCPIGAHTHGVSIPGDKAAELQSMIGQMIQLEYLRGE